MAGEGHKAEDERMVSDATLELLAGEVGLMRDNLGEAPISVDADTGAETANTDYTSTVDLYRVAAEAWREKAGMVAEGFDFRAEGGSFNRSQIYRQYLNQASRYANLSAQLSVSIERAGYDPSGESSSAFDDYLDDGGGLPS
jgi:hypothetical protein